MARDHNCENSDIREDLAILHPNDDSICTYDFGKWRVKGLTRCIGNAYMKKAEFTTTRFSQAPPGEHVTSIFTIYTRVLKDTDKFVIFGYIVDSGNYS
ncbi:putative PPM-type phosphatase domain, protein phosphatase 2C family [Medicago truncatula]|uniref:Putative PPM-type phosphatase domain, protein phosphatase 2C family n=1 Tax=Medicago truncatula TaxID=3880 RepID=A0A396H5A0_MEDTR|nr:probable protein phosphatase 2C 43 [Medicago truncatula]RHN47968.1 putative PPM-type phosphatase domain, protein phosphatase 2C family [Medicago truncatula]